MKKEEEGKIKYSNYHSYEVQHNFSVFANPLGRHRARRVASLLG